MTSDDAKKAQELIDEVRRRQKRGQQYRTFIEIAHPHALTSTIQEVLKTKPGQIMNMDDLDKPEIKEAAAKTLAKKLDAFTQGGLGIPYKPLQTDPSVQKHLFYTIFGKTPQQLYQIVMTYGSQLAGSKGQELYHTLVQRHLKELESDLEAAATEHIKEEHLPLLQQYIPELRDYIKSQGGLKKAPRAGVHQFIKEYARSQQAAENQKRLSKVPPQTLNPRSTYHRDDLEETVDDAFEEAA